MYESHFGLTFKPFGSKAEGPAVFVGPRQSEAISAIHKGLAAGDAVVTVTGPVGAGKTTVVNRALDTIHPGRMAAWVGRMAISSEDILELLLGGFGFKRKTNSTLQRFAAFRRLMHERAASGIPVAIVIEDAKKLGIAALAEVEALTAADTADGSGANIILMGDTSLDTLLSDPELARLKQRIRRRQRIEPMTEAEVRGYLKHAIRTAGGEYDKLFGPGVVEIVAACSGGVPRVINTLCETALTSAMQDGRDFVSAEFMHHAAADAFGYEGERPTVATPAVKSVESVPAVKAPEADQRVEDAADAVADQRARPVPPGTGDSVEADDIPESARNIIVESGRYPLDPDDEPMPIAEMPAAEDTAGGQPAPAAFEEELIVADDEPTLTDIPDLINDTQPELDVLPDSAVGAAVEEDSEMDFDLDAALSPDVESTNVMPGVTPKLDEIASTASGTNRMPAITEDFDKIATRGHAGGAAAPGKPEFNPDDLPTLSNAMRVDLKRNVENTKVKHVTKDRVPQESDTTEPEESPAINADAAENDQINAEPAAEEAMEVSFDLDSALAFQQESPSSDAPEAEAEPSVQAVIDESQPGAKAEPQLQAVFETATEIPADVEDEPAAAAPQSAEVTPSAQIPATEQAEDTAPVMADPLAEDSTVIPEADLTALQAALDAVKIDDSDEDEITVAAEDIADGGGDPVPDITLDQVIAEQQTKNEELARFAEAIGNAGSLEDISDGLAETLFGQEFDEAAAAAVAMGAGTEAADAEMVVRGASNDDSAGTANSSADQEPVAEMSAEFAEENGAEAGVEPAAEVPDSSALRQSVSMRIAVLNKMKEQMGSGRSGSVEIRQKTAQGPVPAGQGPKPEPIERQINTSMTQTLEALNVAKAAKSAETEETEKKTGGFFARFRRSS